MEVNIASYQKRQNNAQADIKQKPQVRKPAVLLLFAGRGDNSASSLALKIMS